MKLPLTTKEIIKVLMDAGASSISVVNDSARTCTTSLIMTRGLYESKVEALVDQFGELRGVQAVGEGEGKEYRYDIVWLKF